MAGITMEDLPWLSGTNNTPGISKVGLILADDVDVEPQPLVNDPTKSGKFSDLVTTNDDLILKNGRRMMEVYVTMNKNSVTDDVLGPIDSGYNANEITFFVPGDRENSRGFANWTKNNKFLILFEDKERIKFLMGSILFPCVRKEIKGTTGAKGGDEKGRTFTFMTEGPRPYLKFNGDVFDGKGTSASADDVKQEVFY